MCNTMLQLSQIKFRYIQPGQLKRKEMKIQEKRKKEAKEEVNATWEKAVAIWH